MQKRRYSCIIFIVLTFINMFICTACNNKSINQIKDSDNAAVSSSAVIETEQNIHGFKTYNGQGRYAADHEKDYMVDYKNPDRYTGPVICSINEDGEKEIIYENDDCGAINHLAIKDGWLYFVEDSLQEEKEEKGDGVYISRIRVNGQEYEKIMERCAVMLQIDGNNLYFKNYHEQALLCYNLEDKTEKKIVDYASDFFVHENVVYSFNNMSKNMQVLNLSDGHSFKVKKVYDTPIIYDGYIYYTRSKSRSDEFKKGDRYYLCRKKIDTKAEEEILYSTNEYIFGYSVFDDFFAISKGKVEKLNDLWGGKVNNKNNPHASLVKVLFSNQKEKIIRDDLSYVEINNTWDRLYFSYEKWDGKRWNAYDTFLAVESL